MALLAVDGCADDLMSAHVRVTLLSISPGAVGALLFVRAHLVEMEAEAERALPGQLRP
jgi:hypothetical protein